MTHRPTEVRKQQTTKPPIAISQRESASAAETYLITPDAGPKAAKAQTHAARHSTTPAGIMIPPPACQFLSAIGHPRITRPSVWLPGFGLGKRVPEVRPNVARNSVNCRDM